MRSDSVYPNRNQSARPPQRDDEQAISIPGRTHKAHHDAAAGVARQQVDAIYAGNTTTPTPQTTPYNTVIQPDNPYHRTHSSTPQQSSVDNQQWQQYHSAWQSYYQKYYERYYVDQVQKAHATIEKRVQAATSTPLAASSITDSTSATSSTDAHTLNKDQALAELRNKLRSQVSETGAKVRRSRHFAPVLSAVLVVAVFGFLQYNRVLFANVQAYVSPGSIEPQNIIVNPAANVPVSDEPQLIIPKINVDVPVNYGVGNDHDSQMAAMENGVAHFAIPGANSVPGQVGNTVIAGHSSNDVFDTGNYKFIFAQLPRLIVGDTIYANYEGTRYTYSVTSMREVLPTDVGALVYETDKPVMTLITCVPIGTADRRLLVTAEQISPDPSEATPAAAPNPSDADEAAGMPDNGRTLLERLFR